MGVISGVNPDATAKENPKAINSITIDGKEYLLVAQPGASVNGNISIIKGGTDAGEMKVNPDGSVPVSQGASDKDVDSITTYEALQNGGSSSIISITPATKIQVATVSTPCVGVSFQSKIGNLDTITIGFSDVVGSPAASRKGIRTINEGDYHYQPISDASLLYVDGMNSADKCVITIHTRS